MRKIILVIIGTLALLASVFIAYKLINAPKENNLANKIAYKPIAVDTVKNKNIPIIVNANGVAEAINKFELFSEVEGVFDYSSRNFRNGQAFKKGDILFQLNNQEFRANVTATRSDFFNLLVSIMPDLKLDFQNEFDVWQEYLDNFNVQKFVKPLPETSQQLKYFITGRGILSAYYNIKNLETRLSKFTKTAPFDGVLSDAVVNPGTLVRPGQRLGEFIDPSAYEVQISLQKALLPYIKENDEVNLSSLDSNLKTTGIISRINSLIDQQTQTVQVFVKLVDENVKEGEYLTAEIKAQTIENAYAINRSLIKNENQVFVVNDTVLDYKTIVPLYFYEQKAVVKGLDDGDVIMTSNLSSAYPKMLVKVE